jgi:hypothetical protein
MSKNKNDKNQQNPVDKIFREGLHDRSFEFDEKYWEEAQHTLSNFDQMKKAGKVGRNRKFWLLGACFIAAGILALLLINPWNNYNESGNEIAQNEAKQQEEGVGKSANEPLKHEKSLKSSQKNQNISANEVGNQEKITELTDNQSNTNQINQTKATRSKEKLKEIKSKAKQVAAEKNRKKESESNKNTSATADSKSKTDQSGNADANPANKLNEDKNPPTTEIFPSPTDTASAHRKEPNDTIDNSNVTANNPSNTNSLVANVNNEKTALDSIAAAKSKQDSIELALAQIGNPKIGGSISLDWFAETSFGVDLISKELSSTTPTLTDWITYRNANEIIRPTLDVSFAGGMQFKNFTLATGANIYAYASDVNYGFESYSSDTTYTYEFDTFGLIIDSFAVINIDTIANGYSGVNKLSYIEIPMLLGYRYTSGKWSLGIQTGPAFAILTKTVITHPSTDLTNIAAIDKTYFRNTSFNWIAKPSVHYMVNENIGLGISGMFRWNLGSLVNDVEITEKYNSAGVQMGIYFKF